MAILTKYNGCYRFNFVLPVAYPDDLSPYEQLCKLGAVVNQIIDELNDFDRDIAEQIAQAEGRAKSYTNEKYLASIAHTDAMFNGLSSRVDGIELDVNNKYNYIMNFIASKVIEIYDYTDRGDDAIKAFFAEELKRLKNYVDGTLIKKIIVVNPTTGGKDSLQNVLNDMYDKLRYFGLTCYEYDSLKLTCTEFDNKRLTASTLDLYAKQKLYKQYAHYAFNPRTGEYQPIQMFLYSVIQETRPNARASVWYDNRNKTASEYDNSVLTSGCYNFDVGSTS